MNNDEAQINLWGGRLVFARDPLIYCLLSVATLAVYFQVSDFEFCNYDDPYMIYQNPTVSAGLTWHGFVWALTTSYFTYWQPVNWWSHMLDCELFGLAAGWHHLVNVAYHVANTLLLFRLFQQLTGAWKRSAMVAAIFALHPVHVESVAWVVERKDVLSTFLFLLALITYVRYVAERERQSFRAGRLYLLVLLFFALGLATKPMLVTFPFVLLLLDFWPLQRFPPSAFRFPLFKSLLVEKIPFFGLTLASSVITYLGNKWGDYVVTGTGAGWDFRLTNAVVSYVRYLGKFVWPEGLIVFYPCPSHWESWQWLGACFVLLLITGLTLSRLHKQPYVIFGWLWFLGTLVPALGIAGNTDASMADRYMYIPSIGLLVELVWMCADAANHWKLPAYLLSGAAGAALLILGVLSWIQTGYWQNSLTLWTHCVAVNPANDGAQFQLGWVLGRADRLDEAIEHYQAALRVNPKYKRANLNIGELLAAKGDFPAATNYVAQELKINPDYLPAHERMGIVRLQLGDYAGAIAECTNLSLLGAKEEKDLIGVAVALSAAGRTGDAIGCYHDALQLNSTNGVTLNNLAWLLAASSDAKWRAGAEAVRLAEQACELTHHGEPLLMGTLAAAYAEAGRFPEAVATAEKAAQLATQLDQPAVAAKNRQLLEHYRASQPYHEPSPAKP